MVTTQVSRSTSDRLSYLSVTVTGPPGARVTGVTTVTPSTTSGPEL